MVVVTGLAVRQPAAPAPPARPAAVDGAGVLKQARALQVVERAAGRACCAPGTAGELGAVAWVADRLKPFDANPQVFQFGADLAWRSSPVAMANVIAFAPGHQPGVIAVVVHRDGAGTATAAGTALLTELGRLLAPIPRERGIVLVSTDGGTSGGQGAAEFARTWPQAARIDAAIVLDSIGTGSRLSLLLRSSSTQGTSPSLVAAVRQAIAAATGKEPQLPGAFDQLSGLAVPYAPAEQGSLLGHGIAAVTIQGSGPVDRLNAATVGRTGAAIVNLVTELDTAPSIEPGGSPVLFVGRKVARGWLVQVALAALLAPTLVCALDLAAGARRRRLPLAPALKALGWRTSTWLAGLVSLWVLTRVPGRLLSPVAGAPLPGRTGASSTGILIAAGAALVYWRFVSRPRLVRSGPTAGAQRTAGLVAGLLGLVAAGVLLVAVNPFALILILPAAHAWLWLPVAARAGRRGMLVAYVGGLAGPVALLAELWTTQGLGSDAPRALVAMTASGYLPPLESIVLALAAAAGCQLGALVLGRYAPAGPATRP